MRTQIDNVLRGLEILKANGCEGLFADHDIIGANSYDELSAEDAALMYEYGWSFDDCLDTWTHFV
jgi:hypothetical protein